VHFRRNAASVASQTLEIWSGRGDGREGNDVLSFANDKDSDRRRRPAEPAEAETVPTRPRAKKKGESPELGTALRTVYQRTVEEDIPPEMLDLLGKLG
jgi:hypothetical protein